MQDLLSSYNKSIANSNKPTKVKSHILEQYRQVETKMYNDNMIDRYNRFLSNDIILIDTNFTLYSQTMLKLNSSLNTNLNKIRSTHFYTIPLYTTWTDFDYSTNVQSTKNINMSIVPLSFSTVSNLDFYNNVMPEMWSREFSSMFSMPINFNTVSSQSPMQKLLTQFGAGKIQFFKEYNVWKVNTPDELKKISENNNSYIRTNSTNIIETIPLLGRFFNDVALSAMWAYRTVISINSFVNKYGAMVGLGTDNWWLKQRNELQSIPSVPGSALLQYYPVSYSQSDTGIFNKTQSYFDAFNPIGSVNLLDTTINLLSMPPTSYEAVSGLLSRVLDYYYNMKLTIDNTKFTEKTRYKDLANNIYINSSSVDNTYIKSGNILTGQSRLGFPESNDPVNKTYISTLDKINMLEPGMDIDNIDLNNNIKFIFETVLLSDADISNVAPIIFRSTLTSIKDTISPEWNGISYMGRPDKFYQYSGVTREISFGFTVYTNSEDEVKPQWNKLNALSGLCYPVEYYDNRTMKGSMIRLTIGNMFHRLYGFINSYNMSPHDDSMWSVRAPGKYSNTIELPHVVNIDIGFTVIPNVAPLASDSRYEYIQLSQTSTSVNSDSNVA